MRRPRPKFKVSFYLYFCCFWINVTQINFENIKRTIQRIISDSCLQLKLWFKVDARAPSIPLLNFPFKCMFQARMVNIPNHMLIEFAFLAILSNLHPLITSVRMIDILNVPLEDFADVTFSFRYQHSTLKFYFIYVLSEHHIVIQIAQLIGYHFVYIFCVCHPSAVIVIYLTWFTPLNWLLANSFIGTYKTKLQ